MDHLILGHDCHEQAKFRHRHTSLSIEKVASERVGLSLSGMKKIPQENQFICPCRSFDHLQQSITVIVFGGMF